jgi:DNA-binding transcriptional LysR family regulator
MPGLLAFEAVARLRSVTAAGEELHVTTSAVSHRLRQLEAQLGVTLFERSDFSLTHEGTAYLQRVREALAILRQVPGQCPGGGSARRKR